MHVYKYYIEYYILYNVAFADGSEGKEFAYNADDLGEIPGSGGSLAGGNGNPLQYSCLENPRDRGAWQFTDHRVTKSQKRLSNFHFHRIKHNVLLYINIQC